MVNTAQTVVYHLDEAHQPVWQYYSMPVSIVGGGANLEDARSDYRDALRFSLDSDELPEIREHIETHPHGLGVWVRLPLTHPNPGPVTERVASEIAAYPEDRDWFYAQPTAGGYPVIVLGEADAPISAILDQMTAFDTVIVMVLLQSPEKVSNVWMSISGPDAENDRAEPLTGLDTLGLTRDSRQGELFRVAVEQHVTRLSALALC